MTVQASWYDDPDPYGPTTPTYNAILDRYIEEPDRELDVEEPRPASD